LTAGALSLPLISVAHTAQAGQATPTASMPAKHRAKHNAIYNTVRDRSTTADPPVNQTPKTFLSPQENPIFQDYGGG